MWILDKVLGKSVYSVRREYDKLREKIDRLPVIEKRLELLRNLDRIEPYVISLEEHIMPNFEKKRTIEFIFKELEKVKLLIEREKKHAKIKNQAQ